ncbi:MAG: tripartite tricarboxylate transporter TctB family protein [Rubrivivax sp.]|nr:tripartite tricarboxylate transporter TctB family protein [Rubrivivax sp.]
MKIKSEKDFWAGLMFVVVGIAFAWGATAYNFGQSARPGPGYFPFGLGVILALIGALILFESLTIEVEGGEKIGAWPLKQGAIILGSVVVFGLLLPRLGMAVTLPILIGISSLASGEFHWKEVLFNAVVLTVGSWAIFIKGLSLVIPLWPAFLTA